MLLAPQMIAPGAEFPLLLFHPSVSGDTNLTMALLRGCDGDVIRDSGNRSAAGSGNSSSAAARRSHSRRLAAARVCPLRLSEGLSIRQGSLRQVNSMALALTIANSGGAGGSDMQRIELSFEPCGPPGEAAALQLEAPAAGPAILQMNMSERPSWTNSWFAVTVRFSQPVRKIDSLLVSVTSGELASILPLASNGTVYQLRVRSQPYAQATFSLPPVAFTNWAGQIGATAYPVQLASVPGLAPDGGFLSVAGRALLPVAMALSASACMGASALLPGVGWVACGGQLLRSLWHLQTLVASAALVGPGLPDSFGDLSKVVHWAAMDGLSGAMDAAAEALAARTTDGDAIRAGSEEGFSISTSELVNVTGKPRPFAPPANGSSTATWIAAIRQHYGNFTYGALKPADPLLGGPAAAQAAPAASPAGSASVQAALGLPALLQGEQTIELERAAITPVAAWRCYLAALLALALLLVAAVVLHLGVGMLAGADPYARFKKVISAREQLPVLGLPQLPLMAGMAAAPALLLFAAHIMSLPGKADQLLGPFMAAVAAALVLTLVAAVAMVSTAAPVLAGHEAENIVDQYLQQLFGPGDDARDRAGEGAAEAVPLGADEVQPVAGEGAAAAAANAEIFEDMLQEKRGARGKGRRRNAADKPPTGQPAGEDKPAGGDKAKAGRKKRPAADRPSVQAEKKPVAEARVRASADLGAPDEETEGAAPSPWRQQPLAPAQLLQLAGILEPAFRRSGWEEEEEEGGEGQLEGGTPADAGGHQPQLEPAAGPRHRWGTGAPARTQPGPVAEAQEGGPAPGGSSQQMRHAAKVAKVVAAIKQKRAAGAVAAAERAGSSAVQAAGPSSTLLAPGAGGAPAAPASQAHHQHRQQQQRQAGAKGPAAGGEASKLRVARLKERLQGPRPQRLGKRAAWQQEGGPQGAAAAAETSGGHDMMRRLDLLSRYGFLVSDLLDERARSSELRAAEERRGPHVARLLANVLCFVQHAACCALLGVLQGRPWAAGLLVAAVVIKGLWVLYCAALRPYAALAALLVELALSCLELLVLLLALLASKGAAAPDALGALALVAWLVQFGLVALVEKARGGRYAARLYTAARQRWQGGPPAAGA